MSENNHPINEMLQATMSKIQKTLETQLGAKIRG